MQCGSHLEKAGDPWPRLMVAASCLQTPVAVQGGAAISRQDAARPCFLPATLLSTWLEERQPQGRCSGKRRKQREKFDTSTLKFLFVHTSSSALCLLSGDLCLNKQCHATAFSLREPLGFTVAATCAGAQHQTVQLELVLLCLDFQWKYWLQSNWNAAFWDSSWFCKLDKFAYGKFITHCWEVTAMQGRETHSLPTGKPSQAHSLVSEHSLGTHLISKLILSGIRLESSCLNKKVSIFKMLALHTLRIFALTACTCRSHTALAIVAPSLQDFQVPWPVFLTILYIAAVSSSTTVSVVFSPPTLIFSTTALWSRASTGSPFTATRMSLSLRPPLAAGLPESMSLIKWPVLKKKKSLLLKN